MPPDRIVRIVFFLLAVLLSVGIGLFDRAQSEVQPAVILLLAGAFVLACARPRDARGFRKRRVRTWRTASTRSRRRCAHRCSA
jgi:hypothetical protein